MRALNSFARRLSSTLLPLVLCPAALAQQQALITVDPNHFAPGQNISTATTGAELQALFFLANPQNPDVFVPQFSPVYAQSVTSNCIVLDTLPCAPIGNSLLGYSPVSTPSATPINWGPANEAPSCLFFNECAEVFIDGLQMFPALTMNLDAPTNLVTALIAFREDGGFLVAFAFNSAGQQVASCANTPGTSMPGCSATVFFSSPNSEDGEAWVQYEMSDPNSDIRFVIIGAADTLRPIARVQFNSPVSLQLSGLLAKVQGVGPGKSLANTVLQAQADYAAGDIGTTCALLSGLVGEVKAQSGKKIAALTALQLLSTATALEAGIGCN